jgi:hypothetical protein
VYPIHAGFVRFFGLNRGPNRKAFRGIERAKTGLAQNPNSTPGLRHRLKENVAGLEVHGIDVNLEIGPAVAVHVALEHVV